jgi:hypothetical protein
MVKYQVYLRERTQRNAEQLAPIDNYYQEAKKRKQAKTKGKDESPSKSQ